MASVNTSNINLVLDFNSPLTDAGYVKEIWRVASGQANGDTAVITPKRIRLILSCSSGIATHDLSNLATGAGATNVTLTLQQGTVTAGQFDVTLTGLS